MIDPSASVELWLVDCDRCSDALEAIERALPRLTDDDRARVQEIGDPHERSRRRAAYTALHLLIERVAGPEVRGEPILRAPGSKPQLSGSTEFNLAHTGAHALIGVSRGQPLGVDVETVRPVTMSDRRVAEIVALGTGLGDRPLPRPDRDGTFLQAWTRLEAFAKARGVGVAQTLTDAGLRGRGGTAEMALPDVEAAGRRLAADAGLAVHDLRLPPGLYGAIAAPPGAHLGPVTSFPSDRTAIERLISARG
jgi:4'-phosphopantetheinyl transferase